MSSIATDRLYVTTYRNYLGAIITTENTGLFLLEPDCTESNPI